jgi:predicted GTPase
MFDNSMAGFDHLDVSRRSSQVTDFRLTDGHGNTISLKISHWSMSGIFQKRA